MKLALFKILLLSIFLTSCAGGGDARKIPSDMKERQRKNIEEGRDLGLVEFRK